MTAFPRRHTGGHADWRDCPSEDEGGQILVDAAVAATLERMQNA